MSEQKIILRTPEGVDVTKRIEQGKTAFFTERQDAEKYATQKRSYQYPLLNVNREVVGYGVPK